MDATTNHQQHQDGSPMQQPPSPSKKRKQHVKKTKDSPFEQRLEDLRAYKEKHGHVNVKESADKSLYTFCRDTRHARNNPEKSTTLINDARIASLNALGFEWSMNRTNSDIKSFAQRIEDLQAYKEKHGHVNVKKSEDKSLYEFCNNMRQARNNPEKSNVVLIDDRIASLDALGFDWTVKEYAATKSFEQRIEDLRAYKDEHGHVKVSQKEDTSLNKFCYDTRYARNNPEKSTMALTDGRIASLDALGFDWSERKKSFDQRIEDLRAYKEKHGHINVRKSDDKSLYKFCINVRHARKHLGNSDRALTDDRIASLGALGFEWSNSGIKSFSQQTDQPSRRKRKQRGQGKVDTASKKKHVSPKCSAKNDKGCAASSDQKEVSATVKDAASLSDPIPNLGHSSGNAISVSPFAVSTTNALLASDNMDANDLTTDVEAESINKHPKSLASILLEEKGKRLVQVKQEMVETQENLKDAREDLDIANDTVTQQAVFTDAWQNKFEELAKLAEAGRVDGAKISEIRNRSIGTGQDEAHDTDMKEESDSCVKVKMVPV